MSIENNNPGGSLPPRTAEQYIHEEVKKARLALKRTQIVGTIVMIALAAETAIVSAKFAYALQPEQAALITSGIASEQIEQHGDEIKASISEKIPAMIQGSPDYVINALPGYRTQIEDKVDDTLTSYMKSTSAALGSHVDDYITANKAQIGAVLDNANDPNAIKALGPGLRTQLAEYLSEKPTDGTKSMNEQVNDALSSLKDVQAQVHHLATSASLTPTEKQTRHALAVIVASVNKQNLQPIPLKEAISAAGNAVASAD